MLLLGRFSFYMRSGLSTLVQSIKNDQFFISSILSHIFNTSNTFQGFCKMVTTPFMYDVAIIMNCICTRSLVEKSKLFTCPDIYPNAPVHRICLYRSLQSYFLLRLFVTNTVTILFMVDLDVVQKCLNIPYLSGKLHPM